MIHAISSWAAGSSSKQLPSTRARQANLPRPFLCYVFEFSRRHGNDINIGIRMRMNRVIQWGVGLGLAMGVAVCLGQPSPPTQSQRQIALDLEQQGKKVEAEAAWRVF